MHRLLIQSLFHSLLLLLSTPIEGFLIQRQETSLLLRPAAGGATSSSLNAQPVSRRDAIWKTSSAAAAALLLLSTTPAPASASSQARVEQWPGLEYLEPILELKLSVQALAQGAGDPSKYPLLKQRLEKFFSGGFLSERNYYAGLGVQYMGQMKYDKNELKEYIRLDKEERFSSMEDTLNSLKQLFENLKQESPDSGEVQGYANQAKASLDRWFALVPVGDVDRVGKIFVSARQADANHNGKLEKEELETMSEEDRTIWQRRIDLVGG
jgi:hypothetical protein